MKSENGVTLVALITIIIVLTIMMTIGIYSGINSYKVIKLEKNIAELRAIQIGIDELYEKSKIYLEEAKEDAEDDEEKNYFDDELNLTDRKTPNLKIANKNIVNKFVNENNVNIDEDTIMDGYYLLKKQQLEEILNIDDINVSENFLINFEKRLVFLVTPLEIVAGKNGNGTDKITKIYSLYQLEDEEKVILMESNNEYEYSIVKEDYKQNIKITHDVSIEKIEVTLKSVDDAGNEMEIYEDINKRKDYCTKVLGLGTRTVNIEIIKDCKIKITDIVGNEKIETFRLYNTPVLKDDMMPFIPEKIYDDDNVEKNGGMICYYDSPEWYDYNDTENIKFATAVVVTEHSIKQYKKNISDTVKTNFELKDFEVKVWIPKNLVQEIKDKYGDNLKYDIEKDSENVTGFWAEAEYVDDQYIPKQY